jgi:maleate cis-trans isomerase
MTLGTPYEEGSAEARARARVGVLVPSSNVNLEPDSTRLLPPRVTAHFARFGVYDPDAVPDTAEMQGLGSADDIDQAARLLSAAGVDVLAFGCTSGTLAHGTAFDDRLIGRLQAIAGVPAVTAAGSIVWALRTLGVRRIAVATPYVPDLLDRTIAFLEDAGFRVVGSACPAERLTSVGQRDLRPRDAYDLAVRASVAECEAIVVSCTDLRAVEAIDAIEAELGKPVITSNQALIAASLGKLDIPSAEMAGGGSLCSGERERA